MISWGYNHTFEKPESGCTPCELMADVLRSGECSAAIFGVRHQLGPLTTTNNMLLFCNANHAILVNPMGGDPRPK